MRLSRAGAAELFSDEADSFPEEPDTEAGQRHKLTKLRALDLAAWCTATGRSKAEYLSFTRDERTAFLEMATRR